MTSICELSISKLGYMAIFMKIWKKKIEKKILANFFQTFLTNQGKNKDENEKIGKMSLIFEFSIYQN